jgi:hypothetical protein
VANSQHRWPGAGVKGRGIDIKTRRSARESLATVGRLRGTSRRQSGRTDRAAAASGARTGVDGTPMCAGRTEVRGGVGRWHRRCRQRWAAWQRRELFETKWWAHGGKFRAAIRNDMFIGYAWFIRRLTDEYTATYIRRLTDEFTGLCWSVETIFLSFDTEECTLFSCSVIWFLHCIMQSPTHATVVMVIMVAGATAARSSSMHHHHRFKLMREISILQIKSYDNLTDLFTKSLPYFTFSKCVAGIGMHRLRDLHDLEKLCHKAI